MFNKFRSRPAELSEYYKQIQDSSEKLPICLSQSDGDRKLYIKCLDRLSLKDLRLVAEQVHG